MRHLLFIAALLLAQHPHGGVTASGGGGGGGSTVTFVTYGNGDGHPLNWASTVTNHDGWAVILWCTTSSCGDVTAATNCNSAISVRTALSQGAIKSQVVVCCDAASANNTTMTFSSGGSTYASGVQFHGQTQGTATSCIDQIATGTGNGTSAASSATSATGNANDLVLAGEAESVGQTITFGDDDQGHTYTNSGGYYTALNWGYVAESATAAYKAKGTYGTGADWTITCLAIK